MNDDNGQPLPAYEIAPLTDREFRTFRSIIESGIGTHITDQKRQLVQARLARRVRTLDLSSFGSYLEHVLNDQNEMIELFNRISTNETSFFRESKQFELLDREVLPAIRAVADSGERERVIRIWSAGCSTGQEPYSIAMMVIAALPGWSVEIVATDVSTRVLDLARNGVYPYEAIREIPERYRERFVQRGVRSHDGKIRVVADLKKVVRFERLNLHSEAISDTGHFDMIFCRNVLIYFDQQSRRRALDRLFRRLAPDGLFLLGHSESLIGYFDRFLPIAPSVYRMRTHQVAK